jgi:rRNA maturation RNase YbeY
LKIRIFYDDIRFRLRGSKNILKLIEKVIEKENKLSGDLNFIITKDRNIKRINKEFLDHDYYTDVIAFGYNENKIINGEVYISFDTIKINANNYKVSLKNELLRVMIHGTLHLCGYRDANKEKKKSMKVIEDRWLKLYFDK